jgi:hypothetical protein
VCQGLKVEEDEEEEKINYDDGRTAMIWMVRGQKIVTQFNK